MTDQPLTDEELAMWTDQIEYRRSFGRVSTVIGVDVLERLIADLRAARAEVENATQTERYQWLEANTLRIRNAELRAEVERLGSQGRSTPANEPP